MISIQAVHFTSRTQEWHRFAEALGLQPHGPLTEEWSEFDGDGILAIHHAGNGGPPAGTTKLQVLVDRLDDVEAHLRASSASTERTTLGGVGDVVTARATTGLGVGALAAARRPQGSHFP